jgi:peptidoglycan hydrolase-like protein with peptidoglycan-binding domain
MKSAFFGDEAQLKNASKNMPPLRFGASGEGVRRVQAVLMTLGYRLPRSFSKGQPDGIYGGETSEAVRTFQKEYPKARIPIDSPPMMTGRKLERLCRVPTKAKAPAVIWAEDAGESSEDVPSTLTWDGVVGKNTLAALDSLLVKLEEAADVPFHPAWVKTPFLASPYQVAPAKGGAKVPSTTKLVLGVTLPEGTRLDPALITVVVKAPSGTVLPWEHRNRTEHGAVFEFRRVPMGTYVASAYLRRPGASSAYACGQKSLLVNNPVQSAADVVVRPYTLTITRSGATAGFPMMAAGETVKFQVTGGAGNYRWEVSGPGSLSDKTGDTTTYTAVPSGNVKVSVKDPGDQEKSVTFQVEAAAPSPPVPPQELLKLITGVTGPDQAFFGAREPGSPTKIRTYAYTVTFSRVLTPDEKAKLAGLPWAVQLEDSSGTRLGSPTTLSGKGTSIDLSILYDYAERSIYVGPVINGKLLFALSKKTTVPFSVPLVPEILARTVDPSTSKTRFPVAIKTQRKWFDTPVPSEFTSGQSDLTKAYDNSILSLAWVKGFPRGKAKYDQFVARSYWFSDGLKETLVTRFQTAALLGKSSTELWAGFPTGMPYLSRLPDPAKDMRAFASCYEQHLAWTRTETDPNDDLKAAIANCDFRMCFEGTIDPPDGNKKQLVTITKCAVFIRDSFDFVGASQRLGAWRAQPPDFQNWTLSSGYTDVRNSTYQQWRTDNGIGHDYLIYSDVEYFTPNPPAQFRVVSGFFGGFTYEDV